MRALRVGVLLVLVSITVFAQRGGGFRGGGFRGGGSPGGMGISHNGFRGGGFRAGIGPGFGFNHSRGFFRPGFRRFGVGLGFGYGLGTLAYPSYYDYGYYPFLPPTVAGPSPYPYAYYDSTPVVVTQNFGPPAPVQIREYPSRTEEYREPIYLIAHKDHRIEAAVAYWVEADTLHYVTRQREKKLIPLDEIDRSFSEQLNRERRVEFQLPR